MVPGERDQVIKATATRDGSQVAIKIEQEGGSGGIAQVHSLVKNLAGFSVEGVRATGSKEVRASPFASQVNIGNVKLLAGDWNSDLISELESFPTGEYSDQVDGLSMAFNHLADRQVGGLPFYLAGVNRLVGEDDWRTDDMFETVERKRNAHWSKDFPG